MATHYIPSFAQVVARVVGGSLIYRPVCGASATAFTHSVEPTCQICARWLTSPPEPETDQRGRELSR